MKRSLGLAFVFAFGAVACGDNGGVGQNPPFVPADEITITVDNGREAARATYLAAAQSGDSAGLVGNAGIGAGIGAGPDNVLKTVGEFSKPVRVAVSQIPFGPQTVPCDEDGTMTISGNLENPLTLSAGDEINIEARNCDDGLDEIIDGAIHFTVRTFDGDIGTGLYELTMAMQIVDFQVTTPDDVLLTNGDATVTIDTLRSPFVSTTVRGDSLTLDLNGRSATLVAYSTSGTIDGGLVPSPYTLAASGALDSTRLGGTVNYSTPVTFEGLDSSYPHKGEMLVRGLNNTSVHLIVLEDGGVQILIDASGNGEPDAVIETTWDALLG